MGALENLQEYAKGRADERKDTIRLLESFAKAFPKKGKKEAIVIDRLIEKIAKGQHVSKDNLVDALFGSFINGIISHHYGPSK